MRLPKSLPLLLLSLALALVHTLADSALVLPSTYDVTQLPISDKNAGSHIDSGEADDTDESIRWGATAQARGSQLQIITQALASLGDVQASQSMLSLETMTLNTFGNDSQSMLLAETAGSQLKYFDGPVLPQIKKDPLNIFITYYGNTWSPADKLSVETFIKALNPKVRGGENDRTVDRWWDITSKYYYDYKNRSIASNIVLMPPVVDTNSQWPAGSKAKNPLKDKHIRAIVTRSLGTAKPSRSSVHYVLTSPEVFVKNFGSPMCTYHSSFRLKKVNVAYAFVGNPATQALKGCSYKYYDDYVETENGVAIDAVINWIAHSLTKAATNPYPTKKGKKGWVVAKTTIENGDLCSWIYGYVGFKIANMKYFTYNIKGGGRSYLIQQNFNPKIKRCVIIARNKLDDPIPLPPFP